ncbi:MAG: TrbC/VirB2 family protein [Treponema sp.]|jgi:type IV secretory pathway VirB2 component (pilin)|nr:TrbC/VirB2 family protein [Treponema sp.]
MKKIFAFMLVICLFAQVYIFAYQPEYKGEVTVSTGLEKVLNTILKFFSSGYMKAIVSIALGGLGIGLIMNRGEPGMIKRFIPWIAGCVILLSLSTITELMGFEKIGR